jgi:RTA1 like protein
MVQWLSLSAGGGLLATEMTKVDSSGATIGSRMILGGVALQLLWFIFFIVVAAHFHRRIRLYPTTVAKNRPDIRWQWYLGSLYFVSAMIVMRSVFRLVEYAQGHDGYLQSQEVFFYVFDAVPMLIVMAWMNWQHPGEISSLLRGSKSKSAETTQTELV